MTPDFLNTVADKGEITKELAESLKLAYLRFNSNVCEIESLGQPLKKLTFYHFSENVGEAGLEFDYRLKEGISKSMNAIKLLKYLGYPEQIVENAELKAVEAVRRLR